MRGTATPRAESSGRDLLLSYRLPIDETEQPYRLYLPTSYAGERPFPLVIAMHGTGGDEATLFDDDRYSEGAIKWAADKHEIIIASPFGRGLTEYRGIGENDFLTVLDAVQRHYLIDADRVYLTGHSMGGTGATYLALHHPDLFAAVAPLAAAYSFPWLARNARHVPFLWIGGADDEEFYLRGVDQGVERMRKFGVSVKIELLPEEGHFGAVKNFDRIFSWLLQQKRDPHPRDYVFEIHTPLHGRAYWTTVHKISKPGKMALIRAAASANNQALFTVDNVSEFSFRPDPDVFDLSNKLQVSVNGDKVWAGLLSRGSELSIRRGPVTWASRIKKTRDYSLVSYRNHPVAKAPEALDMLGTEKLLANWITDAMRESTGAHIAIYNGYAYRGLPVSAGIVDIVDLVQCSRPFDQYLVTARLSGKDLLAILDDNIPDPKPDRNSRLDKPGASQLIQVSGASYVFDSRKPSGERIYTVAMEGQVVERETIRLAGRFKEIDYMSTRTPFTLALYGYAAKERLIQARLEGRVAEAR